MKKITKLLMATCIIATLALPVFAGCRDGETPAGSDSTQTQTQTNGYITLNQYSVTLLVGETFDLTVLKTENGEAATISKLEVKSDAAKIASVSGKTVTANQEGETYIHVKADGYTAACFVTVTKATGGIEPIVRVNDGKLYSGVSVQAYAYLSNGGVLGNKLGGVTWEIVGEGAVSADGIITPTLTQTQLTVKAKFTIDNVPYEKTQTFEVAQPVYYGATKATVKLTADKTLSGVDNVKGRKTEIAVKATHILTGNEMPMSGVEVACDVSDEAVATVTKKADTEAAWTVVGNQAGIATLQVTVAESNVVIPCEVATPISTIEDMDKLAMATLNEKQLLEGSYMLVNDIDYDGEVILPIAAYGRDSSSKREVGVQWKYFLDLTDDGYELLDRANFGDPAYHMTDEEYKSFNGINPAAANKELAFSGTFDGNGYAIKNGQIFYGSMMSIGTSTDSKYVAYASSVFGKLVDATVCNIGFENLKMQNPKDYNATSGKWDITKDRNGVALPVDNGNHILRGGSLISSATNSTIENVYLEIDYSGFITDRAYPNGALVLMVPATTGGERTGVNNNVIKITPGAKATVMHTGGFDTRYLTGQGNLTCWSGFNNLGLGVKNLRRGDTATVGTDGNYWSQNGTWADVAAIEGYAVAKAAFDTAVWSFAQDNTPSLVKNCAGATDLA